MPTANQGEVFMGPSPHDVPLPCPTTFRSAPMAVNSSPFSKYHRKWLNQGETHQVLIPIFSHLVPSGGI